MGLFNFDFLSEADNFDRPRRKGVFLYVEIFLRKFFKLMKANMLYFIVSLPLLFAAFYYMPVPFGDIGFTSDFVLRLFICGALFTFIGTGPASAGFAYILRCFTREEPVWLWSEFWDQFKSNFRQSIVVCIISVLVSAMIFIATSLYFNLYASSQNTMYLILLYTIIMFAVTFFMMHTFIYQLMITYECNLITLYKNAFLLTFAKFPVCLIISAISIVIVYFLTFTLNPVFTTVLYFLILYGIVRFTLEFYAARTVERLIKSNEDEILEEDEN